MQQAEVEKGSGDEVRKVAVRSKIVPSRVEAGAEQTATWILTVGR